MKKYIPGEIESKWQEKWKQAELYKVDLSDSKNHYYVLIEFSYPSGDLHMGHWYAFAVPDILARFKRMTGHKVFFPNGFDAFGLPAENAAIKRNIHPQNWTLSNIEKMKSQFATMGASFDWSHQVITCLPQYYKWNQWIFLKMFEKGLAYKGQKASNWCPSCQTVLANENVEDGKCWRCGSVVEQKQVSQWFLKLTAYADRLLWEDPLGDGLSNGVDWPVPVKVGQNNWIGRSEGLILDFDGIKVFTTKPETVDGATFLVLSPEHPKIKDLTTNEQKNNVASYIALVEDKIELDKREVKEKTGVFTGSYVTNSISGKKIPVWVADYVLMSYGTGAIMAVPFADERDREFAEKFNLPIETTYFKAKPEGLKKINYHLHDWSISRQRYWGTPIPIIYCSNCAKRKGESVKGKVNTAIIDGIEYEIIPVPEKDLPVELPYEVDYAPQGKPPLATAQEWVNVKCPKCGKDAKREVETMDTFIDSSWYFFRYLDPQNNDQPFDKDKISSWMPVDIYFGGAEHTLGHTLYSRFFTKFLFDEELSPVEEYAQKRVNRGLILGPDGQKMSKSKGNVINPDEQVKNYGADAVRLYLAFIGPYPETVTPWETSGVAGVFHFLQRVWSLQEKLTINYELLTINDLRIMHKTIKKVTEDLSHEKFNTAVASIMTWLNFLSKKEVIAIEEYKTLVLLLAPFAPHMSEELWQLVQSSELVAGSQDKNSTNYELKTKNWSIHQQSFPKYDEKYMEEDEVLIVVQINGKLRDSLMIQKDVVDNRKVVENLAKNTPNASKYLKNMAVKKVVYITGKIINFVL